MAEEARHRNGSAPRQASPFTPLGDLSITAERLKHSGYYAAAHAAYQTCVSCNSHALDFGLGLKDLAPAVLAGLQNNVVRPAALAGVFVLDVERRAISEGVGG